MGRVTGKQVRVTDKDKDKRGGRGVNKCYMTADYHVTASVPDDVLLISASSLKG